MRLMVLVLVLMAAGVLAACGDDVPADDGGSTGITTSPPRERTPAPATPTPDAGNSARAAWVETFCLATAEFDLVVAQTEDGINPRTLDLEARRDRGINRYEQHLEGLHELHATLQALDRLPDTEGYHEAVIAQTEGLIALLSGSVEFLRTVESHEEIEAELEDLLAEVRALQDAVFEAARTVSPEAAELLGRAPVCGGIIG